MDAGCEELYVYSADARVVAAASRAIPGGAPGDSRRERDTFGCGQRRRRRTWHLNRAISDDGRRVFFNTADALVPGDANGRSDVYEYDVPTGTVHLISSGRDPSDSYFMDASANGNDVFFLTRQQLVGWDHRPELRPLRRARGRWLPGAGCRRRRRASGEACQRRAERRASAVSPGQQRCASGSGTSSPRRSEQPKSETRDGPMQARVRAQEGQGQGAVREGEKREASREEAAEGSAPRRTK